jgi:hypothetical protein
MTTCPTCKTQFDNSRFDKGWVVRHFEGNFCYNCSWWQQWIRMRDQPGIVRYRGGHYTIHGDHEYELNCYPGEAWLVEFYDGRTMVARCVRVQGAIPNRFHAILPNNARRMERIPEDQLPYSSLPNLVYLDEDDEDIVQVRSVQEPPKRLQQRFLF